MSYFRWIGILFFTFSFSISSSAEDHQLSISGGAALLYGDLDTTSDPGPSIRAIYEMVLNPVFSLGLEGGIQQVEGETWVTDVSSKYYGAHPYKTTIIPGGIFAKFHFPFKLIQPYIEGGGGAAFWIPDKNDKTYLLPTKKKIIWSIVPFASIGGGIFINLGEKWGLDIGARTHFLFSDELDNIDGEYLTGSKGANDQTIQGGIALVYRFGGKKEIVKEITPEEKAPEKPEEPGKLEPEEAALKPDSDGDGIPDELDRAPNDPEDFDGFEDDDGVPDPDNDSDGIPDVSDGAPGDPEDFDGFEDKDGVPDLDNDGDGIPDTDDPFPNIPQKEEAAIEETPYTVHVSSYRSLTGANTEIKNYMNRGYEAFKILVSLPKIGNMYRVYVGHFRTQAEARNTATNLINQGYTGYARVIKLGKPVEREAVQKIGYFIHVSSFKNKQNAQEEVRVFTRAGYQAKATWVDLKEKGIWYRVFVGPYTSRAHARKVANTIKETGLSNYAAVTEEELQ